VFNVDSRLLQDDISTSNAGQSPEMQLRELREYCGRRNWTLAGEYVNPVVALDWSRSKDYERAVVVNAEVKAERSSLHLPPQM